VAESRARFDPSPSSARAARRFATEALSGWGTPVPAHLPLLVSELASNAVLHAGTPFEVAIETFDERVQVRVHDGSSTMPRWRRPEVDAVTGRGLPLVDDLAERWGVEPTPTGKVVWFECSIEDTSGAA
jgi:anti-sigma regulatory factor (Ser/Thr protein kinase)